MQEAYLAIQCKAPTGEIGTFLYSEKSAAGYVLVSPVAPDYVELLKWIKANGWESCSGPSVVGNYCKPGTAT